jgi:ketosteroid isomerase-like protein
VTAASRALLVALVACAAAGAEDAAIDAGPLPLAAKRVPAGADECAVWQRELSFSRSVERHDAAAFAAHLHAGALFNVGTADADRGRGAIVQGWAEVVEGKTIALRWRPGIVQIGGEPAIAVSRGPYILQRTQNGTPVFRVGMFQTVWVREQRDGVWRVLFDGSATSSQPMESRAAAERWVEEQAMSDCAA